MSNPSHSTLRIAGPSRAINRFLLRATRGGPIQPDERNFIPFFLAEFRLAPDPEEPNQPGWIHPGVDWYDYVRWRVGRTWDAFDAVINIKDHDHVELSLVTDYMPPVHPVLCMQYLFPELKVSLSYCTDEGRFGFVDEWGEETVEEADWD